MTAKKILVIDDEPDVVCYISTFLEDEGFDVVSASNGEEALSQVRAQTPDLITLDITMPGMSGIEVLTTLRRDPALSDIPVLVVSGVAEFEKLTAHRGIRPPEGFMAKPIDPPRLLTMIEAALGPSSG